MTSTALAVRDEAALAVTPDQLELIKRTVATGATADELKLYLFDCQRQGVHPLDKLVHFTKRAGKYTPITSIDFMRIRAAETNEYAGSDVPLFASKDGVWSSLWTAAEPPFAAMVTVWRLVQGTRCKFEAVARWAEYKPEQNDFMWRKMPATMLAKCAEALALRKGFPRQLAGLYAKEEMDQAGPAQTGYVVEAPKHVGPRQAAPRESREAANAVEQTIGQGATPAPTPSSDEGPDLGVDLPAGARRIESVAPAAFGAKGFVRLNEKVGGTDEPEYPIYSDQLKALAEAICQSGEPCFVGVKQAQSSKKWRIETIMRLPKDYDPDAGMGASAGDSATNDQAF